MKIIDKTPLVDEKGNLGFQQRLQGMLQFGFNWTRELQVQKAIVTFFDRQLEKGYTLLRNVQLGASGIVIPMILLGPAGVFVISIAYQKGRYQATGESWNVDTGKGYKPAPVNEIKSTWMMARALHDYLAKWQKIKLPVEIEPILIAGDPGVHVESNKPTVRVVMIDGIKSFVGGLSAGRPVMSAESVFELTERILNPRPARKEAPASISPPTIPPAARPTWEPEAPKQEVSRARAIFNASEQAKPFNPNDFDFAMGAEDEPLPEIPVKAAPTSKPSKPKARRILGMTVTQLFIILAMILCLVAIAIVGFVYVNPFGL